MNAAAGAEPCLSHPHNEFLDFWLSSGILGLLAYAWLLYVFWSRAIARWIREFSPWQKTMILGSMGAMLASILHGLIDNSYFLVDLSLLFWLFCGLISFVTLESSDSPLPAEPDL